MLTLALVIGLGLIFATQSLVGIPESVAAAGLIKPLNLASDWWRLGRRARRCRVCRAGRLSGPC